MSSISGSTSCGVGRIVPVHSRELGQGGSGLMDLTLMMFAVPKSQLDALIQRQVPEASLTDAYKLPGTDLYPVNVMFGTNQLNLPPHASNLKTNELITM